MMNNILTLLFTLLCVYLLSTSSFAEAQCLSDNDDLSIVEDTDLYSIQDFNIELFQRIFPKDPLKNFVFSPYSVWNSLVIAYFGSAGNTQKQFEKVLRVFDKLSTLRKWRQLEHMYLRREEITVDNTFVLSNRAYFDESVQVRVCMQNILHNEIRQLKLIKDASTSADVINKFVSEKTSGHINQLVNSMDIMNSYLVLVNAAYFKGNWMQTFDKKNTRNMPFTTWDNEKRDVPMMLQFGEFRYGYDDRNKYEILELPYVGESVSMYIFLPYANSIDNFQRMIGSFTHETIDNNLENMYPSRTQIFIPKFSIDTVVEDELLQAVYKMGLVDAFSSSKANFTDFSFNRNLKLDHSIHKAFIQVNEEGTEAAAATAFISNKIGGTSRFVCNRPFIFIIRDKKTKNILFAGAFQSPPEDASNPSSTHSPRDQFLQDDKGSSNTNGRYPSRGSQGITYQPSTFHPLRPFQSDNRESSKPNDALNPIPSRGPVAQIPPQSSNYSPREPIFSSVKGNRNTKNDFKPDNLQSSISDIAPQRGSSGEPEPVLTDINESSKTNYVLKDRVASQAADTPFQPAPSSSIGRPLPGVEENTEIKRVPLIRDSQNTKEDSLIRRFFTYFPVRRFLTDEKDRTDRDE